jgi:hypothetical protein
MKRRLAQSFWFSTRFAGGAEPGGFVEYLRLVGDERVQKVANELRELEGLVVVDKNPLHETQLLIMLMIFSLDRCLGQA